jgi:hypothetical protein
MIEQASSVEQQLAKIFLNERERGIALQLLNDVYLNPDSQKAQQAIRELLQKSKFSISETGAVSPAVDFEQLQKKLQQILTPEQKRNFFSNLPKGAEVKVTYKDLPLDDDDEMKDAKGEMHELTGAVVAEPVQGYSMGPRIREKTDMVYETTAVLGEHVEAEDMLPDTQRPPTEVSLHQKIFVDYDLYEQEVTEFVITDFIEELAVRRSRELYSGRPLFIWSHTHNTWMRGIVENRSLGDMVTVKFEGPLVKKNALGIEQTTETLDIPIGDVSVRDFIGESTLPEIGVSDFEQQPWLFENIRLDGDELLPPYQSIPAEFRPGALIEFPDHTIAIVERSSGSSGYAYISDKGNLLGRNLLWSALQDEEMPTLIQEAPGEFAQLMKDRRVLINIDDEQYVMKVKSVTLTPEDGYKLILEALPVFLRFNANMLPQRFYAFELPDFNQKEVATDQGPGVRVEELKKKFPDQFEQLMNALNTRGSIHCQLTLVDGSKSSGSVYFHTLPYGIWASIHETEDDDGELSFIELEDVETIDGIEESIDLDFLF